ncbi:MAG: family 10 glycosylhydrolase [Chitinophagaceae bacterium]
MHKYKILFFLFLFLGSFHAKSQPQFWTWIHYSEQRDWKSWFAELKDIGITGVLMNASKEGYEKIIPIADSMGIEIHAWLWIMNNGKIAAEHPEWLDYNRNGISIKDKRAYVDYYKFLNPAAKGVKEAIIKYIDTIASIKGIKGISLDYCRYVDAILPTSLWKNYNVIQDKIYPEWDYGYHPEMLQAFIKKYTYDPRNKQDSSMDAKWLQFRMDKINDIVISLEKLSKKRKIEISASPFPTPEISINMVYQDWGKWKLDRTFPMIYNGFYYGDLDWIASCIKDCRRDMYPKTKLYFGVYAPDYKSSPFSIIESIQIAMENGAEGVAFFDFDTFTKKQKSDIKAYISHLK